MPKLTRPNGVSYIYLISDGFDAKVGVSRVPKRRLKQIETGNPNDCKIVKAWALPANEVYRLEKLCHRKIVTHYVKKREWFKKPLLWDLITMIEEIIEPYLLGELEND